MWVLSIVLLVVEVALQLLDQMEHRHAVEMVEQEPFLLKVDLLSLMLVVEVEVLMLQKLKERQQVVVELGEVILVLLTPEVVAAEEIILALDQLELEAQEF